MMELFLVGRAERFCNISRVALGERGTLDCYVVIRGDG